MKTYFAIICCLIIFSFSCKRDNTQPTPSTANAEKIRVRMRISGDITTTTGTLNGRQAPSVSARTSYDSTLYAVNIKTDRGAIFAQGLFDITDSIQIDLLKDSSYFVYVAAVKRGTSMGLWWQLSTEGYKQYAYPLQRTLRNRMFYAADVNTGDPEEMQASYIDSLKNMSVVTDTNSHTFEKYPISQVDSYYGTTNYTARDPANTTIDMVLKRMSFAIRYYVKYLTSGSLAVSYGGVMAPQTITTNDTLPIQIYTADNFRTLDSIPGSQLQVTINWNKGDGTTQLLGTKPIRPKRNTLTTISADVDRQIVTGYPAITLSDTTWTSTVNLDL